MGTCESLLNDNPSKIKHKKSHSSQIKQQNHNQKTSNKNQNLFCSPIDNSTAGNNFPNMSATQSQLTLGNISMFNNAQRPKEYKYINKYKQDNNLQYSLVNGSLVGLNKNSSMYSGYNNNTSKLNVNSMSMSQSYSEFIIEGKINNNNMEGNKEFSNFINDNKKNDANDFNILNDNNDDNNSNKNDGNNNKVKDVNFYQKKISKNANHNNNKNNLKVIKENSDEESGGIRDLMPLDSKI